MTAPHQPILKKKKNKHVHNKFTHYIQKKPIILKSKKFNKSKPVFTYILMFIRNT